MLDMSTQSKKPVWELHARPIGEPETPWVILKVQASSVIQAEAIMRRRGFEIATQSAILCEDEPDTLPSSRLRLKPLVCSNCGYALAGLTLEKASVTCTECSHSQPLMQYDPNPYGKLDRNHPAVTIFAFIGFLTVLLIMLPIVIPLVYSLF